jgi:hypothetical protein
MNHRSVCDAHRERSCLPPAPSVDITEYKCEEICSVHKTCPLLIAAQDSGSRSPQTNNTAIDADSLSRLKAEIAALVNELNSGLSTVPAINLVCIALNKLRKLSLVE